MGITKKIRIGTRESALALYQAREVQKQFSSLGIESELIEITSDGDIDLVTPLYEMGIQGIFTKSLDVALLQNRVDVAVHSAKDIPTKLAKGLCISAVLKRGSVYDCFVFPSNRGNHDFTQGGKIASSSLRRKTQWINRYSNYSLESLRGNIQTRLDKLDKSDWQGAIFAQAALERLNVTSHKYITLDWMLPAPAQGAMAVVCRKDDFFSSEVCKAINHDETETCIHAERDFLAALHGGCAVPIAAHATIEDGQLHFKGNIFSLDSKSKCEVDFFLPIEQASHAGQYAANEIIKQGAEAIIKTFRTPS